MQLKLRKCGIVCSHWQRFQLHSRKIRTMDGPTIQTSSSNPSSWRAIVSGNAGGSSFTGSCALYLNVHTFSPSVSYKFQTNSISQTHHQALPCWPTHPQSTQYSPFLKKQSHPSTRTQLIVDQIGSRSSMLLQGKLSRPSMELAMSKCEQRKKTKKTI